MVASTVLAVVAGIILAVIAFGFFLIWVISHIPS
jgi:hypothetical protein